MQCVDVQHSAFLTSASPTAQHINQGLSAGKPVTSSSDTFPVCIDYLSVWGLGLKDTIQVPKALQEVGCLPDDLLNLVSAVLGDGSSSITADGVPLHCVGFSA